MTDDRPGRTAAVDLTVAGRHGPVPVRSYPGSRAATTPLVWLHGGGFSYGGLDMPESHAVASSVARTGRQVTAVDYRRVPRWNWVRDPKPGPLPGIRYPVPLDDVVDVLGAAIATHGAVAVGGASAGACLAAAAALRLHAEGAPTPTALVLMYGTFHARLPPLSPQLRARLRGRHALAQFRPSTVHRMNRNYAGTPEAMSDPFAFPGGHDVRGLPPVLSVDADHDSLRASGDRFAEELRAAGVEVEHRIMPGTRHGFLNSPSTSGFRPALETMTAWLDAQDSRNPGDSRDARNSWDGRSGTG
jgi:acetyl esterase/lipase